MHADAEERLFYPWLPSVSAGSGARTAARMRPRTRSTTMTTSGTASAAHASTRWAAATGGGAVRDTRIASSDHVAEEEREALADFRRHAAWQARHDLGIEFAVYQAAHAGGVPLTDRDPDSYVRGHAH
jgi:hypothetical protein